MQSGIFAKNALKGWKLNRSAKFQRLKGKIHLST
jgi:hypothetical protein